MINSRLSLALGNEVLQLPDEGKILVFGAGSESDLGALDRDRVQIVQTMRPDVEALTRMGFDCVLCEADEPVEVAIVFVPRAKALARDLVARAAAKARLVLVDGQKTDGVDSVLKDCRKLTEIQGSYSKAHGKLFWFSGGDFQDWKFQGTQTVDGGFLTRPGVFSADAVDPASRMLADCLPAKIGGNVADFGAGWGYLSSRILERDSVKKLHLVEADHSALDCARENVTDARAEFHWADARTWQAPTRLDAVVTNPPFHTSRSATPELGREFIRAAAAQLAPSGSLWLVANRHLGYETTLAGLFVKVEEIAGDNRFKILHASRPSRARR